MALAAAHGIDFIRVAGGTNNPDGIAGRRRKKWIEIEPGITDASRKRERIEAPDTAQGKATRSTKSAAYSHAELGIAAYGVDARCWAAVQHTIANDRRGDTLATLHAGLRYHANKFADAEGARWEPMLPAAWERHPQTGRRLPGQKRDYVFYQEALCMLVLDEISFRPAFARIPELYWWYLRIEKSTWEKTVLERFHLLQMRYAVWYGTGLRKIQQRINGHEKDAPALTLQHQSS